MDFSNIACWIWPLLTGLICAILGYLLGRLFGKKEYVTEVNDNDVEIESWQRKNAALRADLDACQSKLLNALNTSSKADTSGIGPKIRELFHNFDINTWSALADTSVDKCQEVLNSGGKRFEIHRPNTWPMQAELAALGKWEELKKWQDEHDYGKA